MWWLLDCVFMMLMEWRFGSPAGIMAGTYCIFVSLMIHRYVKFAEKIVIAQGKEIERLRGNT